MAQVFPLKTSPELYQKVVAMLVESATSYEYTSDDEDDFEFDEEDYPTQLEMENALKNGPCAACIAVGRKATNASAMFHTCGKVSPTVV